MREASTSNRTRPEVNFRWTDNEFLIPKLEEKRDINWLGFNWYDETVKKEGQARLIIAARNS